MSRALHNFAPAGSLEAKDLEHMLHPTTNLKALHDTGPTISAKAKGVYLWDNKGKQYLEGMAGLWCTALGYGEEELVRVAKEQMEKLCYSQLFGGRTNEPSILLAEKLKSMVPMDAGRVFFGLSGSDANDTQVKLLWYYHNAIGKPKRKKIIARRNGYHGSTVAGSSLTGLPSAHKKFDLPIAGILHTDSHHFYRDAQPGETETEFVDRIIGNLDRLIQSEGPETVAAFIAEPIPGAGGVIVPPPGYYSKLQALLDRYGIFFIDDEVICGFGRTGNLFGAQTVGFRPTTMTVAKAISSAYLPISAVIIPEFMYEPLIEASGQIGIFGHGFTYSGHPVCAAVALRNLEIMEERNVYAHAQKMSFPFQSRLRACAEHPLVGEARGIGLIGAVEIVADKKTKLPYDAERAVATYCVARCADNGLIVRNIGEIITFCPPLIITEDQVHELFDKFTKSLDETWDWVRKG